MRCVHIFPFAGRRFTQSVGLGLLAVSLGTSSLAQTQPTPDPLATAAPELPHVSAMNVEHIPAEDAVRILTQLYGNGQISFIATNGGEILMRVTEADDKRRDNIIQRVREILAQVDQPGKDPNKKESDQLGRITADNKSAEGELKLHGFEMEHLQRKLQATIQEQQARIDSLQKALQDGLAAKDQAFEGSKETAQRLKEQAKEMIRHKSEAQQQVKQAIDAAMKALAENAEKGEFGKHAKDLKHELKAFHKTRTESQRARLHRLRAELDALERELDERDRMSDEDLDREIERHTKKPTPPVPATPPVAPVPPVGAPSTPPQPAHKPHPEIAPPTQPAPQPPAAPAGAAPPALPSVSGEQWGPDVQALLQQAQRQPTDVQMLNKTFELQSRILDARLKGLVSQLDVAQQKLAKIREVKGLGQATSIDVAVAESEVVQLDSQIAVINATRDLLKATHDKNLELTLKLAHNPDVAVPVAVSVEIADEVNDEVQQAVEQAATEEREAAEEAREAAEEEAAQAREDAAKAAEDAREAAEEAAEEAREAAEEAAEEAREAAEEAAEEAREAAEQAEHEDDEEVDEDSDDDDDDHHNADSESDHDSDDDDDND